MDVNIDKVFDRKNKNLSSIRKLKNLAKSKKLNFKKSAFAKTNSS